MTHVRLSPSPSGEGRRAATGWGPNRAFAPADKPPRDLAALGVSCHTLADAGTSGNVGPNLDDAKPSKEKVVTQVTNGGGAMPPFKGTLDEQQIEAVADYVSSAAGK